VVSLDWKWLFIYPDQRIAAVNQLVIPAGTPVTFRITSATVMNSFFIPQLGSQIYAMGGMATHLNLMADTPGEYTGISAMYSGDGFSDMWFIAKAVSAADFEAWVAKVRGAGPVLDQGAYAALAKPSKAVPPTTYGSVEDKLFEHIIDQTISGAGQTRSDAAAWRRPVQQAGGCHAGQTHLGGNPLRPADCIGYRPDRHHRRSCRARSRHGQGLVALSMERMDHQRRPQAHRRDVYGAGASHAGAGICRCD